MAQQARGRVLNAGCGLREARMGESTVNLDIAHRKHPHIVGDLHRLPFQNSSFDTILNVAVLEHVPRAWDCVGEFYRVLAPGGRVICCVPFLQPVHDDPGDFVRFTEQGLRRLFEDKGFEVIGTVGGLSFFHTLGWIVHELLTSRWYLKPLTLIANPLLLLLQRIPLDVPSCRSANTVIARKLPTTHLKGEMK
jgi:SAM-dependent methyltransferase